MFHLDDLYHGMLKNLVAACTTTRQQYAEACRDEEETMQRNRHAIFNLGREAKDDAYWAYRSADKQRKATRAAYFQALQNLFDGLVPQDEDMPSLLIQQSQQYDEWLLLQQPAVEHAPYCVCAHCRPEEVYEEE